MASRCLAAAAVVMGAGLRVFGARISSGIPGGRWSAEAAPESDGEDDAAYVVAAPEPLTGFADAAPWELEEEEETTITTPEPLTGFADAAQWELEEEETTITAPEPPPLSGCDIKTHIQKRKWDNNVSEAQGFEVAAERVEDLAEFKIARVVRVNPHLREGHVRLSVLRAGKQLVVPQAGLRSLNLLDPKKIDPEHFQEAVTEAGVKKFGVPIEDFDSLKIDLFVVGSMAVNPATGCRLGPFGGLDGLEYEVLRQLKAIDEATPVVTSAHDSELRDDIPSEHVECFDLPADIICTPTATIRTETSIPKATGLDVHKLVMRQVGYIGLLWDVKDRLERDLGTRLPLAENWATSKSSIMNRIMKLTGEAGGDETQDFELAALQVSELPEFKSAKCVRVHPHRRDAPIRLAALRAGKMVVVPQAGMRSISILDPAAIDEEDYEEAVTEAGTKKFGKPIDFDDAEMRIDLFVVASSAVNPLLGCRLGPTGGFEELEYQLLRQLKVVSEDVAVVTTVHDVGVIAEIPSEKVACEDLPVDIVCTQSRTLRAEAPPEKPQGLVVSRLNPQQLGRSDIMTALRPRLEAELGCELPLPVVEEEAPKEEPKRSTRRGGSGRRKAAEHGEAKAAAEASAAARSGKGGHTAAKDAPGSASGDAPAPRRSPRLNPGLGQEFAGPGFPRRNPARAARAPRPFPA